MSFTTIRNRLHLYDEVTWGTKPASPTLIHVPHTTYSVSRTVTTRSAAMQTGLRQEKHSTAWRAQTAGQLSLPLYGWHPTGLTQSLAQWLVAWGLADTGGTVHEAIDLPSKGAEYAEGPDIANKNHHGLRVNTATLTGNGDAGTIELGLDLIGKSETSFATAAAIPIDMQELTEFSLIDSIFQIDNGAGGSLTTLPIKGFQLQVQNNLLVDYLQSVDPSLIVAGSRVTTFSIDFPKDNDTWDEIKRTVTDSADQPSWVAQLILKGLHKGTGTAATNWTQLTFDLPRLVYTGHTDNRGRGEIARLPLTFAALKPDSASNDVQLSVADVA